MSWAADQTNTRRPSSLTTAILICIAYTAISTARRAVLIPDAEAAIWPAAGLMAAGLLLTERRHWPILLGVGIVANVALNSYYGFSFRTLLSLPEAGLLALLTFLVVGRGLNFGDGRKLSAFVAFAVLPACLASAAVIMVLPSVEGSRPTLDSSYRWLIGHALGAAVTLPSMVILFRPRRFTSFRRPAWELFVACGLLVAFVAAVFWNEIRVSVLFVFPAAMFIAFRHGPVGAAWTTLSLTTLALVFIYLGSPGHTPYVQGWVQLFVAVLFLTILPAAGVLASSHRMRALLAKRTETARKARTRAYAAANAQAEFLANMSHEIRTPLNGVIGLADALSHTELNARQREMLNMILASGGTLNGLLSDAIDIARADSGSLRFSSEPFDVRETAAAAIYLFEPLAREKRVDFTVRFDVPHEGTAIGDPLRIRQIISNLTSNAVKFTEHGEVAVDVALTPMGRGLARLRVAVSDTGAGFDEETRARLFSRFEQGDGRMARKFGGAGLGLAISQKLAAMMGGGITCRSAPGQGSTFTFEMLLQLTDERPAPAEPPALEATARPRGAKPKVLLAEDHPVNQKVIEALLGDSVELTVVEDGQAALEALAVEPFDAVLMDTQMPRMDGLTAIQAIRAGAVASRVPIVSLTADAMPQQVKAALLAGADLHLAKPVTSETLLSTLAQALELGSREEETDQPADTAA